jgi:DNA-binding CsgD family transcriptional regulator
MRRMALLEREAELDLIDEAVAAALRRRGSVVLLSGPAGIGKTAVLASAAQNEGVRRLRARAGELERDLALGVARQLFEPAVAAATDRAALLEGTGPVEDALGGRRSASDTDQSAILHGLHRLVANLAAAEPLVLEVDDVQWADGASLRFLAFHARRLDALPVVLLLARRTGEPATDPAALHTIVELPETHERTLTALSVPAASEVVRQLAPGADEQFCAACHAASGGNPFVLRELLRSLDERGVIPDADGAAQVGEVGPPTVARWVLSRLERLPAAATELARAVAVLGDDAELGRAARLIRRPAHEAEAALDTLVASELLAAGRPLDFVHPVMRAAVRDAMPPGSRSRAHRDAARLLRDEGTEPGRVATHLLAAEPAGEPWVVEALVQAARVALAQGAPELAASHAQRALAEPPATDARPRVLRALGNAERRLGLPDADQRFVAAIEGTTDPRERAETVLDMLITGAPITDAIGYTRQALDDVAPVDPGLALILRARLLLNLETAREPMDADLRQAEEELAAANKESLGSRLVAGMLAREAMMEGRPRAVVLPLALRAVQDDDAYAEDLAAGYPHTYPLTAMAAVDEIALAERRLAQAAADAERRGSLVGTGIARFMLTHAHLRTGDLEAADRTARAALHAAEQTSEPWLTTVATAVLVAALTQRGELVAAQQALEDRDLTDTPVATFFHAEVTTARAGLHLARERPAEARADALAVGHFATAAGVRNPVMLPWRPLAALASIALGRRDEASQLAHEELELATAADIPSAIGAAQRVLALTVNGEPMVTGLERAVATLETTPARLELARALTDFGASLRRGGRRTDARGPLSRALELAHRCGAAPLAELARTELLAAGARPRRAFRTGIDALTPSERRVADLAAAGLTNAEIAARLFITIKTTEHHLAAVYRKLDINSRRQLPSELADPRRDEPA